jgi:hypothetical protein
VAEVTDLLAPSGNGYRRHSDIQRAVRNPVQQAPEIPLPKFERQVQLAGNLPPELDADPRPGAFLIFIANGGTSLVPTTNARPAWVCPCAAE